MPNLLATEAGLKLGPIIIETFFKHYLERHKSDRHTSKSSERSSTLREQDLLWQESFEIIKSFLHHATKHTVEELQEFSNARIPVAPWIWVHRVLVPISACNAAACYLIKAHGGEENTKRVLGGSKWWQVRGIRGVDCQWICQKSHLRRRKKNKESEAVSDDPVQTPRSPHLSNFRKFGNRWGTSRSAKSDETRGGSGDKYVSEEHSDGDKAAAPEDLIAMDGTRCMLYAHGGGYYFGSIDQTRYCMQRYARKINGRVFAVNYRLAPQYPFPCAIQDLLAAYLYLIEPPPEAIHAPIPPHLIVLGGDSAGGGLCLAVLQVMRDTGIPLPAAAVLISPWSDLTHSFPSIIQNTDTDVIPLYGLCLHKPSVLWPPPPDDIAMRVRTGLKERFKKVARKAVRVEAFILQKDERAVVADFEESDVRICKDIGANGKPSRPTSPTILKTGRPPLPWENSDAFNLLIDGSSTTIDTQIQLYCPNNLLAHPLVSPVLGYLGGLPPLLVIASDKEVLRDEIVYLGHKAAHPDRFSINEDSKKLYLPLETLVEPYRPTPVHLQVYDDTAHDLPLFSFTTPAKYCYRAIALFIKHFTPVLEDDLVLPLSAPFTSSSELSPKPFLDHDPQTLSPSSSVFQISQSRSPSRMRSIPSSLRSTISKKRRDQSPDQHQQFSDDLKATASSNREESSDSGDIAGNRFGKLEAQLQGPGTAGCPSTYTAQTWPLGDDAMIRERVSIRGALRPLEPESELSALTFPHDHLGKINEAAARRYVTGQGKWARKFANTAKKIDSQRKKNLELAKSETIRSLGQLQEHLFHEHDVLQADCGSQKKESLPVFLSKRARNSFRGRPQNESRTWSWAWALDDEHPPPSSIVSRRDTVEARNLARVADLSVDQEESKMSGNMLWSVLVNFLTAHPDHKEKEKEEDAATVGDETERRNDKAAPSKENHVFSRLKR